MRTALLTFVAALVALSGTPAHAGEDMSDADFATFPIIVVARWSGEPLEQHLRRKRGVVVQSEGRTSIVVRRVLRGAIKPGEHPVLLEDQIGFNQDGGSLWRSELGRRNPVLEPEQIHVPVHELGKPALWFLRPGRSWDKADPTKYLIADRIRCVQELRFEPYYRALLQKDQAAAVAALLGHADLRVVVRALGYLCGGRLPGPQSSHRTSRNLAEWPTGEPLRAYADKVKPLLGHADFGVRMHALQAYAHLAGDAALPQVRAGLQDPQYEVCAVAVALLAERKDAQSIDAINRAAISTLAGDTSSFSVVGEMIRHLDAWDNERLIPALIALLHDMNATSRPDFPSESSLMAQDVLYRMTGFVFPTTRSATSLAAWNEASKHTSMKKRLEVLEARLQPGNAPLMGRLVPDPDQASGFLVEIINRSRGPVTLSREPNSYTYTFDVGRILELWHGPRGTHSYVTLQPGRRLRCHLPIPLGLFNPTRASNAVVARFTKPYRPTPAPADRWLGGVWIQLAPQQDQVLEPTPAQAKEIKSWWRRLLAVTRAGDLTKARRFMSWVSKRDIDSWSGDLAGEPPGDPNHAATLMGRLEVAFESGAPRIVRTDILGDARNGARGPIIHLKVRFGEGLAADTLMLVCRRVGGKLLLGRIRTY